MNQYDAGIYNGAYISRDLNGVYVKFTHIGRNIDVFLPFESARGYFTRIMTYPLLRNAEYDGEYTFVYFDKDDQVTGYGNKVAAKLQYAWARYSDLRIIKILQLIPKIVELSVLLQNKGTGKYQNGEFQHYAKSVIIKTDFKPPYVENSYVITPASRFISTKDQQKAIIRIPAHVMHKYHKKFN